MTHFSYTRCNWEEDRIFHLSAGLIFRPEETSSHVGRIFAYLLSMAPLVPSSKGMHFGKSAEQGGSLVPPCPWLWNWLGYTLFVRRGCEEQKSMKYMHVVHIIEYVFLYQLVATHI
jgi:hypothetical protein